MGINVNGAKEKLDVARAKKGQMKQSKMKHTHKMDYINASLTVLNSVADLTNTIFTAKQETKRLRLQSELRQSELAQELDVLKVNLEEKRAKMAVKVEKMRLQHEERMKELDNQLTLAQDQEETKRLQLQQAHTERMEVLAMQREMLHFIMEAYKRQADQFFNGHVSAGFEEIGRQMQACITTINTALQVPTSPQYIDMP